MYFPTSSSDSPNRLRITVSCLNEFLFQKSAGALTSKQHGNSRVYTAHLKRSSCPKKSCYSADWILLKELLLSTELYMLSSAMLLLMGVCTWEIPLATLLDCDSDH